MKLLIIRHGDPDYSIDSLTPTGWKEAQLLADRLCQIDVKAFYCSPLGRARDTASLTLQRLGREAAVLPWLQEFSAKVRKPNKDAVSIAWDWLPMDWTKDARFFDLNQWTQPEAFANANMDREAGTVFSGVDTLLAEHGYLRKDGYYQAARPNEDTIVLFCHFGVSCLILSHLLHISPMLLWHGTCAAPSSVTSLITEERRKGIAYFRMNAFGDTSHLYAAGQEPAFAARFCETYDNPWQRRD